MPATASAERARESAKSRRDPNHRVFTEKSPKRVRVVFNGATVADSVGAALLFETGHLPVYYFPRADVDLRFLRRTDHRTHCPYKGDASYWSLSAGEWVQENAVWSYEHPLPGVPQIEGWLAFYWDKVDHWFEEDEEVFGHPHDPHHLIDIRNSTRTVRVIFADEEIAFTRRARFLFETGLPTRYYIPPEDVRRDLLEPSRHTSVCAYKGRASYWSLRAGKRFSENAAWAYLTPNPEYLRIGNYFCFYPEKVDRLDVEGNSQLIGPS